MAAQCSAVQSDAYTWPSVAGGLGTHNVIADNLFAQLRSIAAEGDRLSLFPNLTSTSYQRAVQDAAGRCGLAKLRALPHLFRHGGPSTDVLALMPGRFCCICGGYARVSFAACSYCGDSPSYHTGRCCPWKPPSSRGASTLKVLLGFSASGAMRSLLACSRCSMN